MGLNGIGEVNDRANEDQADCIKEGLAVGSLAGKELGIGSGLRSVLTRS